MTEIKRQNAVRNLSNLYTIIVGVALSLAVGNTVDAKVGMGSLSIESIILFYAFVVTAFPFYHGALRHLDDTYVEASPLPGNKDGMLVIDVLLLLLHGVCFVLLSQLLSMPNEFAWVLITLLMIDVIWGVFVHHAAHTTSNQTAEWKWTIINFTASIIVAAYLVHNDIYLDPIQSSENMKLAVLIALLCSFRTIIDYVWGKDFYFPKSVS